MSVVINGVEMPKDCESCLLSVRDPLGGFSRFCKVTKNKVAETKRADDCPLVDTEMLASWHWSTSTEPCPYP